MTYIEWEIEIHPDQRDAAFYSNNDTEVVGVIRSKDMVAWEPIYVTGEMKCFVDKTPEQIAEDPEADTYEVVKTCVEWEYLGIKTDADLAAAEVAGRTEWYSNPWFEIFDTEDTFITIDEVIEFAKTYKFE